MNTYIAYLRVSTTRQGATGVSLSEQRLAISSYAQTHHLQIECWDTETQSAASRRRPIFEGILRALRTGKAAGLLVHKIDRGTRTLADWARIGEMTDRGANVHFVHDDLDPRCPSAEAGYMNHPPSGCGRWDPSRQGAPITEVVDTRSFN